MAEQFVQTVAYMCPHCAAVTSRQLNIFEFSGKNEKEFCCGVKNCREKSFSFLPYRDKYKISVMCPICCHEHEIVIGKAAFWSEKYLELKCPDTGMKIFFVGNSEKIKHEVKNQEKMLADMSELYAEDNIPVLVEMFEVIEGMNLCRELHCECGSEHISVEMADGKIKLLCLKCGAMMKLIPSDEELERILAEGIVITKHV